MEDLPGSLNAVHTSDVCVQGEGQFAEEFVSSKRSSNGVGDIDVLQEDKMSASNSASVNSASVRVVEVAAGWAKNSVNTVIFRKNSLVSLGDTQYAAWYDQDRYVVLSKRSVPTTTWTIQRTQYQGNTADAHNSISIMIDGAGYLHLSWDHHDTPLRYCRSQAPGSLVMGPQISMTSQNEQRISYPEFYRLADGNLLFFFRNGASGGGNLVINRYNTSTQQWTQLHQDLIDGQGQRNAYWQACLDTKGGLHLSWVWRDSSDVATNHDLGYAHSGDGGLTWEKSTGEKYVIPITAASTEYASRIPTRSELINQTSMASDDKGFPYIATYWREAASTVPQYHLVYFDGQQWRQQNLSFRTTAFTLSGGGTKAIPISRPQIVVAGVGDRTAAFLIFRDVERGRKVSVAQCRDIGQGQWVVQDLTADDYGSWEPTYDTELWKQSGQVHLFVQNVVQIDGEGTADVPPQPIRVLEWSPVV